MTDTDQVSHWQGDFGDLYIDRNAADAKILEIRTEMWRRILKPLDTSPTSILEVGANVGTNIQALAGLVDAELHAVEPNEKARTILADAGVIPADHVHAGIASDLPLPDGEVDMAFTSGVLIHVNPDDLAASCAEIHRVSRRYIVCVEYFNPTPVEVEYRGHTGLLFKRDFGAFWMDQHPDLELIDYGFFWKRATGLDDLTWWLFRKKHLNPERRIDRA
jgi:pseudaminic acid biosynthesis-associated methylase